MVEYYLMPFVILKPKIPILRIGAELYSQIYFLFS